MNTTEIPTPRDVRAIATMRRIHLADLAANAERKTERAARAERRKNGYRGLLTRNEVAKRRAVQS